MASPGIAGQSKRGTRRAMNIASQVLAVCRKKALPVLALLTLGLAPGLANATCTFAVGAFQIDAIDLGNVTMPLNPAIGTILATKSGSYDNLFQHQGVDCGANVSTTATWNMTGAGSAGIYPTNIPGIGIRVSIWSSTSYWNTPQAPTPAPLSYTYSYPCCSGNYGSGYLQVKVELIVTDTITNFGTNALSYSVGSWLQFSGGGYSLNAANLAVTATLNHPACSVTTTSVHVALPSVSFGTAPAGTTKGATPFDLVFDCAAGAYIAITLSDASNSANTSNVLSLASGSGASGVGLQIPDGATVVSYGADSSSWGNPNQLSLGTATGGPMDLHLTAQYTRTAGPLVPGPVNALATFTMSYQ